MSGKTMRPNIDPYHADNLIFRHAEPTDDPALQQLLRDNPMQGWVTLSLQRRPSYFASEDLIGSSRTVIALDAGQNNQVMGMYSTTFMPFFYNGKVEEGGYLGELRVNKRYRNRLRILKHGFDSIHPLNLPASAATSIWFTSIASDNLKARRLLESKNRQLPKYTPAGELQTLAISTRQGSRPSMLQAANKEDIPAICELYNQQASQYNFATLLDPSWMRRLTDSKGLSLTDFWVYKEDEEIQAAIAVWDQRSFKQVVVQGYRSPLKHLRPLVNLLAYLAGKPLLPREGSQLETVYLSFFCYSPKAEKHVVKLLREALHIAANKNADTALLGISADNPLLPLLRSSLHPVIYRTCIETVSWEDKRTEPINSTRVQPEIAIL